MRARMKKRALGIRTFWDLHIFTINVSVLASGVVMLIRAMFALGYLLIARKTRINHADSHC